MSSPPYEPTTYTLETPLNRQIRWSWLAKTALHWQVFMASMALVVLPVFFQAPLVRAFPWVSLALTAGWLALGMGLMRHPDRQVWGDLIIGFSWTWLAGSLYWGWLRWEPVAHLPIEAIGLPIAFVCLRYPWGRVGSYFFLGSLLGTAVTDLYINWMGLFPAWRQIMRVDFDFVPLVLRETANALQSDLAAGRAVVLVLFLLIAGLLPLVTFRRVDWWAFSGAVLSTLIVDGLFFISACFA